MWTCRGNIWVHMWYFFFFFMQAFIKPFFHQHRWKGQSKGKYCRSRSNRMKTLKYSHFQVLFICATNNIDFADSLQYCNFCPSQQSYLCCTRRFIQKMRTGPALSRQPAWTWSPSLASRAQPRRSPWNNTPAALRKWVLGLASRRFLPGVPLWSLNSLVAPPAPPGQRNYWVLPQRAGGGRSNAHTSLDSPGRPWQRESSAADASLFLRQSRPSEGCEERSGRQRPGRADCRHTRRCVSARHCHCPAQIVLWEKLVGTLLRSLLNYGLQAVKIFNLARRTSRHYISSK